MAGYALTIFLSAFLLFQVQPLIGKRILPWFGGTPAVWTTCMLFFQVLLLAGYAYAHLLSSKLPARRQGWVHAGLLAGSLLFLPIIPNATWKPTTSEAPSWQIMVLLGATIGMPYFLLSSTGPLLQEGFRRNFGRQPYRLYALSNVGSLLALLSYPFLFEPQLSLHSQAWTWSAAYAVFVVGCSWCVLRYQRTANVAGAVAQTADRSDHGGATERAAPPRRSDMIMWLLLAACGSIMLLATTNQVCQEIAVVPFLWIVPLALYLLTFIICFETERWYDRTRYLSYLATAAVLSVMALAMPYKMNFWVQLAIFLGTMWVACMVCHGELVKSKPHPRYLTLFYLLISLGGALGGAFVALIAPNWFTGFWEYAIGLALTCLLALVAWWRSYTEPMPIVHRLVYGLADRGLVALVTVLAMMAIQEGSWRQNDDDEKVQVIRNFYGLLRVSRETDEYGEEMYQLTHGKIEHGFQFVDPDKSRWPTTYYGPESGVGVAIIQHPRRLGGSASERKLRVGVVGLGCGTLACYGQRGDYFRFYEINPEVIKLSDGVFTYCKDSRAQVEFALGDARVQMEHEIAEGRSQQFDVLAVDAFSSDAIPMHLLTRECIEVYKQHLKPDGILCLHISNKYLDLRGLVRGLAQECGYEALLFDSDDDDPRGVNAATWVLLTNNKEFIESPILQEVVSAWPKDTPEPLVWTDDYGSLFQVVDRDALPDVKYYFRRFFETDEAEDE